MNSTDIWNLTKNIGPRGSNSAYVLPKCEVFFSEKLARSYKPTVYSHECSSGTPEAVYYRIIVKNEQIKKLCIQYFFYWAYQQCMAASHRYDYEPIFIYLQETEEDEDNPYLIVNEGLGSPDCNFHKIEIRPRHGKREKFGSHFEVKISPKQYYPFGKNGNVVYKGCSHKYPLEGNDLQFDGLHPLFGIRACSNIFSGAGHDLQGEIFNPPLKKLTDRVLKQWYFKHYNDEDDMPFGHDVADPFTYPYIRYHCAKSDLPKPRDK